MSAGHRIVTHAADLAVEAWAPGKGTCIAEALKALVESFADVRAATAREMVTLTFGPTSDEKLLVRMLNEVLYQFEAQERLPADITVDVPAGGMSAHDGWSRDTRGRAVLRFAAVPAAEAEVVGAIPKAVSWHEFRFARANGLWRCRVTVDI